MMDELAGVGAQGDEDLVIRCKRALYRAQHRGTKEMDWMIGRYAAAKLATMSPEQLQTFETLLAVGDPEINTWLIDPVSCGEAIFASLIEDIRAFHTLA